MKIVAKKVDIQVQKIQVPTIMTVTVHHQIMGMDTMNTRTIVEAVRVKFLNGMSSIMKIMLIILRESKCNKCKIQK
jgi:hypothetical protein